MFKKSEWKKPELVLFYATTKSGARKATRLGLHSNVYKSLWFYKTPEIAQSQSTGKSVVLEITIPDIGKLGVDEGIWGADEGMSYSGYIPPKFIKIVSD